MLQDCVHCHDINSALKVFDEMSEPEDCGVDEVTYGTLLKKRVMVVVDQSSHSKHSMMWALTHVTNKGDILTLLHIVSPNYSENDYNSSSSPYLATTLGSLCKASKPEVEVEALVIQGPKMATVISQVKKLEVSVLVLGRKLSGDRCSSHTKSVIDHDLDPDATIVEITFGDRLGALLDTEKKERRENGVLYLCKSNTTDLVVCERPVTAKVLALLG
ncbi:pentatricopeptide repeat-containing protein at5g10690 [Phtheirospermum japonicum]|uniref:Pentatricopeptide repeat-containing protein at5g10690 n=1 Tax=Phtheirospermum japonicum TaxID=374723 RepID=A0A830B6F2_9LAMI|nr:pentatricopeptide repeat-containing protein at5g10690 [Phtheirospermum japonicum]